ncbi:hypothetical protein F53441_4720 [Fusarium austroafricanum]|uniref:Uncharacterized protein n=1 Tax=Fusarium austroafricanum TaxID=2364996 RepID=A0A8H4KJJ9_9HYPO|nr:hypothetical protein F53441_4720 [Fusarium austroafricanum]
MTSLELQSTQVSVDDGRLPTETLSHPNVTDSNERSLPPVDKGKDAHLFLTAAFLVDYFVWGSGQIATIGTTAMGIMYFGNPFIMALWRFFPKECRYAPFAGVLAMCGALAASSFSQQVT